MVTVPLLLALVGGMQDQATGPDSVALTREFCWDYCHNYRILLTRTGRVSFRAMEGNRIEFTASDTVPTGSWGRLAWQVGESRVLFLPERIPGDSVLCPDQATDWGTASVTVYAGIVTKRVEDDNGCFVHGHSPHDRLLPLRALESAIDDIAGVGRWLPTGDDPDARFGFPAQTILRVIAAQYPRQPRDSSTWFVRGEDTPSAQFAQLTGHRVDREIHAKVTCPSTEHPSGDRIGHVLMVRWSWKNSDSVHVFIETSCSEPPENRRLPGRQQGSYGSQEYILTRRGDRWLAKAGQVVAT